MALPNPQHGPLLEWQADRIHDPVRKLQFLRSQAAVPKRRPILTATIRLWLAFIALALIALFLPTPSVVSDVSHTPKTNPFPERRQTSFADTFADVWLVEQNDAFESYSNGLRIDNSFSASNGHRFYQLLELANDLQPLPEWRSEPVGIVFHTTESMMAPFAVEQNQTLKRLAEGLLGVVRHKRSYNFVIDRFGRVWRIVPESEAANHSGNSVWADDKYAYINLNASFLGIAFEAQTGQSITSAQIHSGRILTEMLRARYRISNRNCVTHAQVSVSPVSGLIGYHTDWASNFPFRDLGLPPNYDLPVPAVRDFGFDYDDVFKKAIGENLWKGLAFAASQLETAARQKNLSPPEYRQSLRARYRRLYVALKGTGAVDEGTAESRSE